MSLIFKRKPDNMLSFRTIKTKTGKLLLSNTLSGMLIPAYPIHWVWNVINQHLYMLSEKRTNRSDTEETDH